MKIKNLCLLGFVLLFFSVNAFAVEVLLNEVSKNKMEADGYSMESPQLLEYYEFETEYKDQQVLISVNIPYALEGDGLGMFKVYLDEYRGRSLNHQRSSLSLSRTVVGSNGMHDRNYGNINYVGYKTFAKPGKHRLAVNFSGDPGVRGILDVARSYQVSVPCCNHKNSASYLEADENYNY